MPKFSFVILVLLVTIGVIFLGSSSVQNLVFPSQTPQKPTPTPKSTNPDEINATGDFEFSGQKIKYNFTIPKKGGPVSGSLEGVCKGTPTGIYDGQTSIIGNFTAKCGVGPLNVDAEIKYTGKVYLNEGKINIIWESTSPREQKGSFDLFFKP